MILNAHFVLILKMLFQKTLTKATVELVDGQSIEDGFQLLVGLAEIHVPRMWVEKKTGDLDHQVVDTFI